MLRRDVNSTVNMEASYGNCADSFVLCHLGILYFNDDNDQLVHYLEFFFFPLGTLLLAVPFVLSRVLLWRYLTYFIVEK